MDERRRELLLSRGGSLITAVSQDARGQARNRELALKRLAEKIAAGLAEPVRRARPGRPGPRASSGWKRSGGRGNASGLAAGPAATTEWTADRFAALAQEVVAGSAPASSPSWGISNGSQVAGPHAVHGQGAAGPVRPHFPEGDRDQRHAAERSDRRALASIVN